MIESPKRLYKFGRTTSSDVMERFDTEVHFQRNWRNTPLASDYDVKPLWSTWVTKEEAAEAEKWFRENYPKAFHSEVKYNGITECRDWSPRESYAFMDVLEKKYPKDGEYWQRIEKLRENNELNKNYQKIYFVMLTKK